MSLMTPAKYQAEIDGLRAIAILSVILFHINELFLPGGFTGVDIFFVISGYLITSNIYPQIEQKTFSFEKFYCRRIKRLLPSLYFVLILFSTLGLLLLLPDDLEALNQSLKKIVVFLGNQHFSRGRDYFSPLTSETPFLHTWSLAIEEQFYFIWPILIFMTARVLSKGKMLALFLIGALLSFSLGTVLLHYKYNLWTYFSFPTRYGELLSGALLAMSGLKNRKNASLLTGLGFVLILASFLLLNKTSHFPGFSALLPCLGTLLILYSGDNPLKKILAFSPMAFVGLISYQLYLWHWPILAYQRYVNGTYFLSNTTVLFSLLATFTLSVLTWKFVEVPLRYHEMSLKKAVLYFYLAPTAIILTLIFLAPRVVFKSHSYNGAEFNSYGTHICHGKTVPRNCLKGTETAPRLLLMGDSHAAHLNSFMDTLGKEQGWSTFVVTSSGCSPVLDFDEGILPTAAGRKNCVDLKNYFLSELEHYPQIAIAARWDFHLGYEAGEVADTHYLEKLKRTFDLLQKKNKTVYVFSQIPLRKTSPLRAELLNERFGVPIDQATDPVVERANSAVKALTQHYPNILWVDISTPMKNFETLPLYKDKDHLNIFGATHLAHSLNQTHALDFFKTACNFPTPPLQSSTCLPH